MLGSARPSSPEPNSDGYVIAYTVSRYGAIRRGIWPIPRSRAADRPNTAADIRTPYGSSRRPRSAGRPGPPRASRASRGSRRGATDVPVGREADVVEHDLVEAGPRCRSCDVDVVLPDALVVRVRPPETGRIPPDRPVGAMDGEIGSRTREHGILERDDAPDEVDPTRVHPTCNLARGVVVAHGAGGSRQRNRRRRKADLAVLVLHVELERRQALVLQIEVLVELPRQRRKRRRHVDAAKLDRKRSRASRRRRCERREIGNRRLPVVRPDETRTDAQGGKRYEKRPDGTAPPQALPPPYGGPTLAKSLVRVDGWEQHRHRGVDPTSPS